MMISSQIDGSGVHPQSSETVRSEKTEGRVRRIGVDVGGTKILAVEIDSRGAVVDSRRIDTTPGQREVTEGVLSVVDALVHRQDAPEGPVTVGVGIPGQVDSRTGRVSNAVNMGITDLLLGPAVTERTGLPCVVENDVNAAALGARYAFSASAVPDDSDISGPSVASDVLSRASVEDTRSSHSVAGGADVADDAGESACDDDVFAFLNLGTGLAAGILINGRLLRGTSGVAGEIGHIPVDDDGSRCSCGQRGCLETVVAGEFIARLWLHGPNPISDVFAKAEGGDRKALEVRDGFVDGIAKAVRLLVLSVDPSRIAIGGGQSRVGEPMMRLVRQRLKVMAQDSPFLTSLRMDERIELVPPETPIGAIGAAVAGSPRRAC